MGKLKFKMPSKVASKIEKRKTEVKQEAIEQPKPQETKIPVSRAELMAMAKVEKIKYFRILNKEELAEVLMDRTKESGIVEKAKARWQAGWGKRKEMKNATKES